MPAVRGGMPSGQRQNEWSVSTLRQWSTHTDGVNPGHELGHEERRKA